MRAAKRRKLEAAGWSVGAADNFLDQRSKKKLPVLHKLWLKHEVYGGGVRVAWLVVLDPCAGRKRVYTVYRISLTANKTAHVIGRELPLPDARRVVREDMGAVL